MSIRWLITGAKGFIGGQFVKESKNNLNLTLSYLEEADIVEGVNLERKVLEVLERSNPQAIFHFGACSNTLENRLQYIMVTNFEVTNLISNWCKSNARAMIYSSSAAVYGNSGVIPSNLYAWSKYTAEKVVLANGGVALRYFNVYGPGEDRKGSMASVFLQSYLKAKNKVKVELFPGKPQRDFVYINDVLAANLNAYINYETISGKCFDVGTGAPRTFEEGLNLLGIKFSYAEVAKIPMAYQFRTAARAERRLPGWNPEFSLESGMTSYKRYLEQTYGKLND